MCMDNAATIAETMSPEELNEAYEAYGDYREEFDACIRDGQLPRLAQPKTFSQFIRRGQ